MRTPIGFARCASPRSGLLTGLFAGLLLLTGPASTAGVTDHPKVQGTIALLDKWIEAHQAYERVPGISVGVVLDQDLIWHQGYGYANVRRRVPTTEKTLYSICSISKLFTSVALMRERDAGHLQLDDPVGRHLDWFDIEQVHPDSAPITIRSLLTHSSGLPRESVHHYWNPDYPFPTRDEMVQGLKDQQTLYPEGTFFQYSNLALTLAGEIAAARAGQPYPELIQTAILDPLELTDTRPFFPVDLHGRELAYGYGAPDRDGERRREPVFDTAGITPAAGFTSNVVDLAKFASWQFRLLSNGGEEVLRASTLREMHRVHWTDPDWETTWGLGFMVERADDQTVVGHDGGCPGYTTLLAMVPKSRMAVIVLINAGGTDPFIIGANAFKLLGPVLKDAAEDENPGESPDLSDYMGTYDIQPWASEFTMVQVGDELMGLALPTDDPVNGRTKLKRIEGDRFHRVRDNDEGPGEVWEFERDQDGNVIAVTRHNFRMPKVD